MTPKVAGPGTSHKCQVSGHRSHNTGPSSQVSGHGSQVTNKEKSNFYEIKQFLAFVHTLMN